MLLQEGSRVLEDCIKSRRRWVLSLRRIAFFVVWLSLAQVGMGQSKAPDVYDVVPYSAVQQGAVASVTSYHGTPCSLDGNGPAVCDFSSTSSPLFAGSNFQSLPSIVGLSGALNASIATALAVIPVASPASSVITKTDPATGAQLPSSSTLGPILTERAETIGKHKFYIGLSNQDFHFSSLNGHSIKNLRLLDAGGFPSNIYFGGQPVSTFPATVDVHMDVRLSQNIAFLTYGLTNRFDISVGLPIVHAAVSSRTFNGLVYVGDGMASNAPTVPNCWCVDTFTPGSPPTNGSGLILTQINFTNASQTGFGDMLLRLKGTVIERRTVALAIGTDLRFPTGDERNFLGTGAFAGKPFAALSLYTKPWKNRIVFAPHMNVGWQFAGKSILGGGISGATPVPLLPNPPGGTGFGPPFTSRKDFLPDILSWAVGTEIAFGVHNTIVLDILGNQIGLIHGIQDMRAQSLSNVLPPQTSKGSVTPGTVSGLVSSGRVSFGQYSGSFGYKARVVANLVATFNALVRFDKNGLTDRVVPLFGLSYTF